MAMNKKEQARMTELESELKLARALRWSDAKLPEPDVDEGNYNAPTIGWLPGYEVPMATISYGVTHYSTHSMERLQERLQKGRPGCTQGGVKLYSRKKDALLIMRAKKERVAANLLLSIDKMIEGCE